MPELTKARLFAAEIGWLKGAPPEFRAAVLERTRLRTLKAGEVLHFSGDDAIGMYGLTQGRLRVGLSAEEHGSYFVHLLRPGDWIGEGPSITRRPRVITPTASCACELLFLPRAGVHEIVSKEPAFWPFFVSPLLGHFELALGIIADLLLRDHRKRIAASLLRLAGCRAGPVASRGRIEIDASQEDIAIMANVARNTAGLTLREFAAAGLIEVGYGKATLLQPRKLRAMLK